MKNNNLAFKQKVQNSKIKCPNFIQNLITKVDNLLLPKSQESFDHFNNSKIDIDDNNEAIQYYQYLRETIQASEIPYWIGNPSVEIISGKILLQPFKPINSDKQPQNYELYLKEILHANFYVNKREQQQVMKIQPQQNTKSKSRCLILCGIPNSKSPVEVMQTECISGYSHLINQIRVIKTVHIRYYGMLLLMKDNQSLQQFFNQIFGSQYTCLEMQRIIIREVRAITLSFSLLAIQNGSNEMNLLREINQNSEEIPPQNIFMTYHHQQLKEKLKIRQQKKEQTEIQVEKQKQKQSLLKSQKQPQKNYNELVCAICFQQCNYQAISILCGHYFDLYCLQKWSQNICPLCRYHQQPPIIKFCQKCNQCQGLWVCLICGSRLCCGVNNNILGQDSHIYDHYKLTNHSLSMQLETKFLFDAKIPAFLHQKFYKDIILSRNSTQNLHQMQQKTDDQCNKKSKITQQIQQYEFQVSQQMNKQRIYFQQQININIKQHRAILAKQRQQVQTIQSKIQTIDNQQYLNINQINEIQARSQKNQKQLQIIKNLIKIKQNKVKQKLEQINKNNKLKTVRLKQLNQQINQKKQEILNYRKNLKLKHRFTQQLKGQQIQGEFILTGNQQKTKTKKKNKK